MQDSDAPTKIPTPWASSAPGTNITNPVPVAPQTGGHASFTEGYPPVNSVPIASGGIPPWGTDTNGILYMLTAVARWFQAGGPNFYDGTFATDANGYPAGAIIPSTTLGLLWQSTADNNTTDPDAGGANWSAIPLATRLAHGECYLSYVSATSIKLAPYNGCGLISGSVQYQIVSGGVTAANTNVTVNGSAGSNLANSTTYYVSYDGVAGVLKFWNASTYSHAADTTAGNIGVEVITLSGSPVARQTLVGLVVTNSAGQFQAQGTGTISWFNRRPITIQGTVVTGSTASVTPVEVSSSGRTSIAVWGQDGVYLQIMGTGNGDAGFAFAVVVGVDGVVGGNSPSAYSASTGQNMIVMSELSGAALADGAHTISPFGSSISAAHTANFQVGANISMRG